MAPPRPSVDGRESVKSKSPGLRWRKWQGRSTGLEDLIQLSASQAGKSPAAPPAYGEEDNTELALPAPRFSESSQSEGSHGSHGSSGDQIYGATTTTTHTVSTHTTFFKLPRRNKNRKSLFPLPVKIPPPSDPEHDQNAPPTPHASHNQDSLDAHANPKTALRRANTESSPSKRNTFIAPKGASAQSQSLFAGHSSRDLGRPGSQKSRKSSTSSPLQPPMRLGLRDRASTNISFGRASSMDTPPLPTGSARNSTSTTGRSSLGGFLSLSRFRQDSDSHSPRRDSPGSRSKSNSFATSGEVLAIPERKDGETPGKYLERLEAAVSRSMIAGILSQSADAFAQAVLRSYTRRFPFFGEPIDMSLRKFLLEADLPKETQQVDRVIQAFADRYHECNPGVFVSPDQAYVIAFSLMMLHTDAFNKNNKRKMQKADYIKNTSGQRVSDDVLACFYDNICYTPFVHYEEEVDINGERVLQFKPKKSKLRNSSATESVKKPSGPLDPYNLLVEQKLDMLRPSIRESITLDDPYNSLGSRGPLDVRYLQRAFSHTGVLQIISARSRPTAYEGQVNLANPNAVKTQAGIIDLKITKVGTLWRKTTRRKKARSPWQEWGAILTGSQLYLFKNANWAKGLVHQFMAHQRQGAPRTPVVFKPPLHEFKPDALIKTDDAVALVDATYLRHKHAFTFVRHGGQEEMLLADNDSERNDWLALINYAAAFRAAGVRIRGMVGVNEEDARGAARRLSAVSAGSAKVSADDVPARDRAVSPQLQQQIMAARRQVMVLKIAALEREIVQMLQQLDDMVRDARHLMVLAPIAQRSREDVIHAAARADATIKWLRRDIWRIKSYRDILTLDVQQDGALANDLLAVAARASNDQGDLSLVGPPRSPTTAFTLLTQRTSVREAADEFVEDVFRTPPETATLLDRSEGWRLPPLRLDVDQLERQLRRTSASDAPPSAVAPPSPKPHSMSHSSSVSSHRRELLSSPVPAETIRAVTPTPSIPEDEDELLTTAPMTPVATTARSLTHDGASATSPESGRPKGVRRSLQKTLREVQHHQPTIHKHRRGKESESTVRSSSGGIGGGSGGSGGGSGSVGGLDGNGNDAEQQQQQQQDGTPGLERAKGRFILHGKQASVIEFGDDWPRERMRQRRDVWRFSGRRASRSAVSPLRDGPPHSPVVRELVQDGTDESRTASAGTSAAQSFVDTAEVAQGYSRTSSRSGAAEVEEAEEDEQQQEGDEGVSSEDDDDEEENTFYDLSSWDPDTGKRDTIIGPPSQPDASELSALETPPQREIRELPATEPGSADGGHESAAYEQAPSSAVQMDHSARPATEDDPAGGKWDNGFSRHRGDRRTVIGPPVLTRKRSGTAGGGRGGEADEEVGGLSLTEHIGDDELRRLSTQSPPPAVRVA